MPLAFPNSDQRQRVPAFRTQRLTDYHRWSAPGWPPARRWREERSARHRMSFLLRWDLGGLGVTQSRSASTDLIPKEVMRDSLKLSPS